MKNTQLIFLFSLTSAICVIGGGLYFTLSLNGHDEHAVLQKFIFLSSVLLSLLLVFISLKLKQSKSELTVLNEGLLQKIAERIKETEKLSLVASKTDNAVIIADKDDVIEWVNDGFTRMTGYSFEEAAGKKINMLRGKDTSEETIAEILKKVQEKKPFTVEILNYKKDKTPFWLSLSITPIPDENGNIKSSIAIQTDITERKKTEEKMVKLVESLKSSEANLSSLIENARDSIWSLDTSLRVITFNSFCHAECLRIYGTDVKVGMHLDEYIPPAQFPEANLYWKKLYERALAGEIFSEEQVYGSNEDKRHYLVSYYPIMQDGNVAGVSVFSKEITEIKKVSKELEKTVSLVSATFDLSNEGILAVDKTGKIVNYNSKFAEMWSIPPHILSTKDDEAAIKHVLSQLKSPESFIEKIQYLYSNPHEESYDIIEFNNGKFFERYSLPQQLDGEFIGRVWTFRDITNRVQGEQKLKKAAEEIYDLYNNAPCGYHSIDADGNFVSINDTELSWLGYKREEIIGKLKVTDVMTPMGNEVFKNKFTLLKEQGFVANLESEFIRKDGSIIPVLLNATTIKDAEGKFLRTRTTIYNIEDRKKIETELLRAKQIADEALKFREQFIANISHEIRTPLSGISGIINLMTDTRTTREQQEFLAAMKTSADNMMVIINDILDISKIDAGKIKLDEFDFELNDVVENVIGILKPRAEEKHIGLLYHTDKNVPPVMIGDSVRLNQILLNLLNNSIKFTEQGSVKLEIKQTGTEGNRLRIQFIVSDTGIGIPPDMMDSIFESFEQAGKETASNYGGSGLGLAIVKKLVDIQHGSVKVESKVGEGSQFIVDLQFTRSGKNRIPKAEKKENGFAEHRNKKFAYAKVLLTEDNSVNLLLAKKLLQRWGIEPDIAGNGKICIEKSERNDYDLILMDVQMPEMNGYDAARHIREKFPKHKNNVPIIAMTARASVDERNKCLEAGMNEYISKPFGADELFGKISVFLKPAYTPETVQIAGEHAAAEPAVPYGKIIDLTYLYKLADGSNEFVVEMITYFIKQTPSYLNELKRSCEEKNWDEVKIVAHRMKPSVSFVGIHQLVKTMEEVEVFAERKINLERIPLMIENISTICMEAIDELKTVLQKIAVEK